MYIHHLAPHRLLPHLLDTERHEGQESIRKQNFEIIVPYYRVKSIVHMIAQMDPRGSHELYICVSLKQLKRMMTLTFTDTNILSKQSPIFDKCMRLMMEKQYVLLNDNGIVTIDKTNINAWYEGHLWEGTIHL